jgi:hypothetical protein
MHQAITGICWKRYRRLAPLSVCLNVGLLPQLTARLSETADGHCSSLLYAAGIMKTVRKGLEVLAGSEAYDQLLKMRGKMKFTINLNDYGKTDRDCSE